MSAMKNMMMTFSEISTATLDQLTAAMAAAGRDSTMTDVATAREGVAMLLNDLNDLELLDSETGDTLSTDVTDEQACESCHTPEGHIMVDGRRCYVA